MHPVYKNLTGQPWLVSDQNYLDVGIAGHRSGSFDRNFRADPVRIANRQRDGLAAGIHSGNASRVSKRELSQTTMRSLSFGALPFKR